MALLDDGVIAIERSSLNIPRSRFSDEILSFITMRELLGGTSLRLGGMELGEVSDERIDDVDDAWFAVWGE